MAILDCRCAGIRSLFFAPTSRRVGSPLAPTPCRRAMAAGSRRPGWCWCASVRAAPKGVMFITIEDETGIANLVVWPQVFDKQRRAILGSGMMAVYGRIQSVENVV